MGASSPRPRSKLQIRDCDSAEPFSEPLQDRTLVKLAQFLKWDCAFDFNFQHAAAKTNDACDRCVIWAGGFGPRGFESQSFLLPSPAASREKPAEDFRKRFRTFGFHA